MRIVLLTGNASNQAALAVKVAAEFELAGIVIEKRAGKGKKRNLQKYVEAILDRTLFKKLRDSWFHMLGYYSSNYNFPLVNICEVNSINSKTTLDFLQKIQPDIVMVSGTGMIKKEILNLNVPKGILNLHTGLSPYIKGGPNCTNWCLATNQFHLIGNTVMFIDAGIDSGDLILTETTPLTGDESMDELHLKVMEHAHELYIKALHNVSSGNYVRIKQKDIATGKTYYTRDWTNNQKWNAVYHYKKFRTVVKSSEFANKKKQLILAGVSSYN